jgi:hypothetical protein
VDQIDTAIAARMMTDARLPLRVPLSSGRVVDMVVPRDATADELADLAAILLGPVRAECAANRGEHGHLLLVRP